MRMIFSFPIFPSGPSILYKEKSFNTLLFFNLRVKRSDTNCPKTFQACIGNFWTQRPLAEVLGHQCIAMHTIAISTLSGVPPERFTPLNYRDLHQFWVQILYFSFHICCLWFKGPKIETGVNHIVNGSRILRTLQSVEICRSNWFCQSKCTYV